jgi:hypothetical protein
MGRLNELRLIARVAQMYHAEGKRQAEIAEAMRGILKKFNETNHKAETPLQSILAEVPPEMLEKLNAKVLPAQQR